MLPKDIWLYVVQPFLMISKEDVKRQHQEVVTCLQEAFKWRGFICCRCEVAIVVNNYACESCNIHYPNKYTNRPYGDGPTFEYTYRDEDHEYPEYMEYRQKH